MPRYKVELHWIETVSHSVTREVEADNEDEARVYVSDNRYNWNTNPEGETDYDSDDYTVECLDDEEDTQSTDRNLPAWW